MFISGTNTFRTVTPVGFYCQNARNKIQKFVKFSSINGYLVEMSLILNILQLLIE